MQMETTTRRDLSAQSDQGVGRAELRTDQQTYQVSTGRELLAQITMQPRQKPAPTIRIAVFHRLHQLQAAVVLLG